MNHVMRNCSPRGIARRVALGRWDYSTEHILGLRFTINFLGQGFGLKEAPASFLSARRWLLTRETPQHFSQIVEISTGKRRLVATGYAMYPGGWLCQVYEKDLHVPDEDTEDTRLRRQQCAAPARPDERAPRNRGDQPQSINHERRGHGDSRQDMTGGTI